ncbi:hypothetical protein ACQ86N_05670 [Puia sp. P3]|uniref:hypothetical protein n=1 Tax=Puia sp. P3 TaxID=3423952 RepID=UPI003D67017A
MKAFYTTKTMLAAYLCCVFYLFIPSTSFAQAEPNNPVTYDTTITEKANGEGPFTWNVRITRQKSDASQRPGIFFIPGSGEVGTNAALLRSYGPHYFIANGWDGGIKLGNGTHYPVIVSIQQPTQNMRPLAPESRTRDAAEHSSGQAQFRACRRSQPGFLRMGRADRLFRLFWRSVCDE